jgi:cystathionine beta-synthase
MRVHDMPLSTPLTITSDVTCKDAISLLKGEGFDMVPVLEDNSVIGVVTEGNMTTRLLSGRAQPDTTVADAGVIYKTFHKFNINATLADLAQALDSEPYALIVTEQRCFVGGRKLSGASEDGSVPSLQSSSSSTSRVITRSVVSGIVTRIDLLDFVSMGPKSKLGANLNSERNEEE